MTTDLIFFFLIYL